MKSANSILWETLQHRKNGFLQHIAKRKQRDGGISDKLKELKEQLTTMCRPYLAPNSYIVCKIFNIYETIGNLYNDRLFDITKDINALGEIIIIIVL